MITNRTFYAVFISIFFARTITGHIFLKNLTIAISKMLNGHNHTFITHFITIYACEQREVSYTYLTHIIAHANSHELYRQRRGISLPLMLGFKLSASPIALPPSVSASALPLPILLPVALLSSALHRSVSCPCAVPQSRLCLFPVYP